jgi:hypothetical protein
MFTPHVTEIPRPGMQPARLSLFERRAHPAQVRRPALTSVAAGAASRPGFVAVNGSTRSMSA